MNSEMVAAAHFFGHEPFYRQIILYCIRVLGYSSVEIQAILVHIDEAGWGDLIPDGSVAFSLNAQIIICQACQVPVVIC